MVLLILNFYVFLVLTSSLSHFPVLWVPTCFVLLFRDADTGFFNVCPTLGIYSPRHRMVLSTVAVITIDVSSFKYMRLIVIRNSN